MLLFLFYWPHTGLYAQQKKTLKIAAYDLNPYVSKDRNEHGFIYDLVSGIFQEAGYDLKIEFFPPLRARNLVTKGVQDVLLPTYPSPNDSCCLSFSQPMHGSQIGYLKRSDLNGKISGQDLSQLFMNEEEGVLTSSSDKIVRMLDMLVNRRLNVAVVDKFQVSDALVNMRPHLIGKVKFIMPALASKSLHIAVSKKVTGSAQILEDFNRGLENWQHRGDYEKLLLRYGYALTQSDEGTLNIGVVDNPDMQVLKQLSQGFSHKHPDKKINWLEMDENILRRNVLSSLALGDKYFDVVSLGNYDSKIYAEKGWIDILHPPAAYDVDDLLTSVKGSLTHKGELFALPFYSESSLTYYRRDLLQAKGITMPEHLSYEDIRAIAAKIHDPQKGIYGICLRGKPGWGENVALISTIVDDFGGQWVNRKKQMQLRSPSWINAITFYLGLLNDYGPPDAFKNGFKENLQLFAEGHCGLWIDASVAASYLLNPRHSTVSAEVGFSRPPQSSKRIGLQWFWVWALAVPSTSGNKALANEFIAWATSKEYAKLVADTYGWLSAPPGTRFSLYANPAYQKAAPFAEAVKQQIESGYSGRIYQNFNKREAIPLTSLPEFTAIGNIVGIQISLALQGKLSVVDALTESERLASNILWNAGYR